MKKHLILLLIATMGAAIFTGCKKYEDGPRLSLKTKKSRVANEWIYEKVTAPNGTDQTQYYVNYSIEFKKDGTYIASDGTGSDTGTWIFASDKEDIVLTENSGGDSYTRHILRLKEKELWYSVEDSHGVSEFHLKPR